MFHRERLADLDGLPCSVLLMLLHCHTHDHSSHTCFRSDWHCSQIRPVYLMFHLLLRCHCFVVYAAFHFYGTACNVFEALDNSSRAGSNIHIDNPCESPHVSPDPQVLQILFCTSRSNWACLCSVQPDAAPA